MKQFNTILFFLICSLGAMASGKPVRPSLIPKDFKAAPFIGCSGHARTYPEIGISGFDSGFFASGYSTIWNPGDTIVFNHTDPYRRYFAIADFHGTAACPIVIINKGGRAQVEAMSYSACSYIKVTGTGDAGTQYGFFMDGKGSLNGRPPSCSEAVHIDNRSKCIEVDHLEVFRHCNGIKAKQDPSCVDSIDYPNWIMDSLFLHDNYFHNIGQDVLYLGNTVTLNGVVFGCGTKYAMRLAHAYVWNNIIDSANRTGIQLSGCAIGSIHDNVLTNLGYEYATDQGSGIIIGGLTYGVDVYNNTVSKTFANAYATFGKGRNNFYNNTADSTGYLFIDPSLNIDSVAKKIDTAIHVINSVWNTSFYHIRYNGRYLINTYVQPASFLVQPDRDVLHDPTLDSTVVVIRNSKFGLSTVVDASYNVLTTNSNKVRFTEPFRNPYGYFSYVCSCTTMDGVTPIGGPDVVDNHIFTDCSALSFPSASAGINKTITLPTSISSASGTGTPSSTPPPSGTLDVIDTYLWSQVSGPSTATINSPTTPTTTFSGLINAGVYTFRLTVTQSNANQATSTMTVTVSGPSSDFKIVPKYKRKIPL